MTGFYKQPGARRKSTASVAMLKIPTFKNTLLLVPRMLGATFSAAVQVFYLTVEEGWPEQADANSEPFAPTGPEPVAGRVHWTAGVGDRLQHRLSITNVGERKHKFSVVAAPFRGTDVLVDIDVTRKSLAPGQSLDAVISLTIPDSLAGGRYAGSVVIDGASAQRLVIELTVKSQQDSLSFVEQGDRNRRVGKA